MTRIVTLVVLALVSLYVGFFAIHPVVVEGFIRVCTYPTQLAIGLLFAYYLWKYARQKKLFELDRPKLILIGACLAATTFLFTREAPGYKIFYDEPILVSASYNLHKDRDPVLKDATVDDALPPHQMDKRPFFFPFLLSIIHDVSGYRVANGHILNFAVTFLLLISLFKLTSYAHSKYAGYMSVLACCAVPLLAQNASGLGFELLNMLLLIWLYIFSYNYWKEPNTDTLNLFIIATIALSNTRYESAVYAIPAGIIVVAKCVLRKKFEISWLVALAPLFYIALAWQITIVRHFPRYLQLKEGETAFGFHFIPENLLHALNFFLTPDEKLANTPLIGGLGFIAVAYAVYSLAMKVRERKAPDYVIPFAIISCTTIGLFFMIMAYYWGQFDDPVASRLSLPLWIILLVAIGYALAKSRKLKPWLPIALGIAAVWFAMPSMSKHIYTENVVTRKQYHWVWDEIGDKLDNRSMVITEMTRMFQNKEIPSISLRRAMVNAKKVDLHQRFKSFNDIYIIQNGYYEVDDTLLVEKFLPGNDLGPAYELETISQTAIHPFNWARISKLKRVRTDILQSKEDYEKNIFPYVEEERGYIKQITLEEYEDWKSSFP